MRRAFALLALCCSGTVHAGTVVSAEVNDVSVTIYRAPGRNEGQMDRDWPEGYALISETRTLTIPAGENVIRFEGVADGLLPETAIVTGLPKGVREKNRDARLLSPAGLVDAYLKRSVHLRRTDRKTGKVVEQNAVIQSGPNGGVLLKTPEGFEALGCAGLPQRMLYDTVPQGLSARPTLSVITQSDREQRVTVQLTYMAEGFDWSANYVANMRESGRTADLFAWLTIANGGTESFRDARLQVIAGQPNKEANAEKLAQPQPELRLQCWPMDITSTHPRSIFSRLPWARHPMAAPIMVEADGGEEIIVTGAKRSEMLQDVPLALSAITMAKLEELGDLKLYRVPGRVTVSAQGQKQVAMINQPDAEFSRIYRVTVSDYDEDPRPMPFLLRAKNVKEKGLGIPLPAGRAAIFEPAGGATLLAGEDDVSDLAIGEDVEFEVGESPDVTWCLKRTSEIGKQQAWKVEISNARAVPVKAEIIIPYELAKKPKGLERGRGGWKLPVTVPANDTASITYKLKLEAEE